MQHGWLIIYDIIGRNGVKRQKMNILNQNQFQAERNCSGAVQLPPGRVMELCCLHCLKLSQSNKEWWDMKNSFFFFFTQYAFMNRGYWRDYEFIYGINEMQIH